MAAAPIIGACAAIPGRWTGATPTAPAYDARDDSILVSLRTQDCIVKFDRRSGALRWILGAHGNWRKPWSDKLLKPDASVAWQFHQHDCSITPSGTILCFDNGNHRAQPFAPPMPAAQSYSRAVEFAVDEANGTVRQVWSYGEAPGERLYAGFQGGAMRLPKTGNTFITYGGICSIDGRPASGPDRFEPGEADARDKLDIRARLLEVTPDREVVLDLQIGGAPGRPEGAVGRSAPSTCRLVAHSALSIFSADGCRLPAPETLALTARCAEMANARAGHRSHPGSNPGWVSSYQRR